MKEIFIESFYEETQELDGYYKVIIPDNVKNYKDEIEIIGNILDELLYDDFSSKEEYLKEYPENKNVSFDFNKALEILNSEDAFSIERIFKLLDWKFEKINILSFNCNHSKFVKEN